MQLYINSLQREAREVAARLIAVLLARAPAKIIHILHGGLGTNRMPFLSLQS